MSIFVAIQLSSTVIASLSELVKRLQPYARLNWLSVDNLHLPLKYLGEWPSDDLDTVIAQLNTIKLPLTDKTLHIPLAGLGFSPNSHSPRVFWVGVENTTILRRLASLVDSTLQPLGIAPEVRPYTPHLTLASIARETPLDDLLNAIEDLPSREFGVLAPGHFSLFQSGVIDNEPVYRKVADFPLFKKAGGRQLYSKPGRSLRLV
ncbi:MAG: RNA 2',3'-cyclic phosphodiesterase [Solibacterales bacterium]|nr:RNA 2',3'-cyclic phosphodiesterase [Bryobacterales bacterium]|tara:strand:- start:18372 stop:18986 length:615 start_codon:yes stop_codon:yes gene_type:complete